MGRQRSQIEVVERQISVVDHDLGVLLAELGMHVLNLRQPVVSGDTQDAYQALAKEKGNLDELETRILHLQQIGQSVQDAHAGIEKLKQQIAEHEQALKITFARIGVIAWEESSSSVLSDVIRTILPTIGERQQKVAALKEQRDLAARQSSERGVVASIPLRMRAFVVSRRLEKYARGHEEFFVATGKAIADASAIRHLASSSAVSLDDQFHEKSRQVAAWREEMSLLQDRISHDKNKLEQAGVAGSVERKIQDLQQAYREKSHMVSLLSTAYARTICLQENPWKAVDVNAETLRCYDQIRRHERIRKQLEKRIDELRIESDIGELVYLIEQDEERIRHIQLTIEQHNRQIEDIQRFIGQNRERIGELKRSLAASLEREE